MTASSLFDNAVRDDIAPACDGDSEFGYLNRSARPSAGRVRAMLDAWFARYPEAEQEEMRRRLRATDNSTFLSAFFELYLHELLICLDNRVEIHPAAPSGSPRRPDFLVHPLSGEPFYLEAIVATDRSSAAAGAETRMNEVYDAINDLESPNFFLDLRLAGAPGTSVPRNRLKAMIRQLLQDLDPDVCAALLAQGGLDALPSEVFEHDGWYIEVIPTPKSPESRGKPGIRPVGARFYEVHEVDYRTPLRNAILKKAGRYGRLDRPFVVAVNVVAQHIGRIDVMEALFGKERYFFAPYDPARELRMERAGDGAWVGPHGPQNTRVSAALIVRLLRPWTAGRETPRLYHNPYASWPATDLLDHLPRAVPVGQRMDEIDGATAARILGLPDTWPLVEPEDF